MSTVDSEILFRELGGNIESGFATLDSPVSNSPAGVPYLSKPGIAVLARPSTHTASLTGFLSGFNPSLNFSEYVNDPTPLPDGAQLCKIAGQTCYMSFGPKRSMNEQAKRYFDNLKSSGHGSVFEHANYSLLFYGISRSVTHELIRHRAGFGFSQLSQRYVGGRTLRFVERPEYQNDELLHTQFLQRIERAADEYATLTNRLLEMQNAGVNILSAEAKTDLLKKVRQSARSVLPNETETVIVVTGNVRAWRHFIEERASTHAEVEIRELGVRAFLCLQQADSVLFDDYTIEQLADGTHIVKTEFVKV
jgi:thymidylate synthase (FAD)